jgi:hypothetical protein
LFPPRSPFRRAESVRIAQARQPITFQLEEKEK